MLTISILLVVNLVVGSSSPINDPNSNENFGKIVASWAEAGFEWLQKQNCAHQNQFSEQSCAMIQQVEKSNFRIYAAEPVEGNKYGVVFPEGETKHKVYYDAILVLDPFPVARFGHPIAVFHAHLNVEPSECDLQKGFFIPPSTCIQAENRTYFNTYMCNYRPKLRSLPCPTYGEVLFLPLVHLQTDLPIQLNDQLQCFPNIKGFVQSCPHLRSKSETNHVSCDPILTNRDCGFLENTLRSRCSMSQTCDYAILLSGGWNRQLSDVSTYDNVMDMKNLLMVHGYLENNIEIFYANGPDDRERGQDSSEEKIQPYHSSSLKSTMRHHIKTVCDSILCADSLFIYLNSPTRPDGASLLWDTFDNGMYDESEVYTARELMRDISNCKANRVIIMADQSYGAALVSAAESRFSSLENVIIYTSDDEFNNNANKDRLTQHILRSQYNDICLSDLKNSFYHTYKSSIFVGTKANLLNSTLVGGPCSKSNSLNNPDNYKYRGCSVSAAV